MSAGLAVGTGIRKTAAASSVIKAYPCTLLGVLCASGTTPTIVVYDSATTNANQVTGTVPLTAGAYTPMNLTLANGLYVTVGGTSPDVTLVVQG